MLIKLLISAWLKIFFVLTPFFAVSMFLSMTGHLSAATQRKTALRAVGAAAVITLSMFFFGTLIFKLFGITLDAFRIGSGALLFLSAVTLLNNTPVFARTDTDTDIAVVPLAIPVIVGPATIGTLMVLGAESVGFWPKATGALSLLLALSSVGCLLVSAPLIERIIGRRGLNILSKITGLVLSALSAQMVLTGVRHFFSVT